MSGYSVERSEHGILVHGEVPLDEFGLLAKLWQGDGYSEMDMGIAAAEGATFAIVRPGKAAAWRKELEAKVAARADGDAELAWLLGTDTGSSSLTIFSVLSANHAGAAMARCGWPSTPLDPDDFGRCYRLLLAFPAWRERLSQVVTVYPEWGPLVREWNQIEALFLEEAPSGRAPKCYALMKRLLDGADA